MELQECLPVWDKLTYEQQKKITESAFRRKINKGEFIHIGGSDCTGLILVEHGQIRAYMTSDKGKEITLYRLIDLDICLFSASCIMHSIQFEIVLEAEKETDLWIIPSDVYKGIMDSSASVCNFTNEIMATRFSEVMWLMEQILWKSFDKRLAEFLLKESNLEGSNILKITHEEISRHLGSPREVVTRMLRYFQNEGMVKLSRGTIEIIDFIKLDALCSDQ